MNYKVIENNSLFSVIETQTEQVISIFEQRADAKQLSKQLNLGCGFDGWTPTFILTPTK
jgi:hypothetical protein